MSTQDGRADGRLMNSAGNQLLAGSVSPVMSTSRCGGNTVAMRMNLCISGLAKTKVDPQSRETVCPIPRLVLVPAIALCQESTLVLISHLRQRALHHPCRDGTPSRSNVTERSAVKCFSALV